MISTFVHTNAVQNVIWKCGRVYSKFISTYFRMDDEYLKIKMTRLNFRIEVSLKNDAQKILKEMGLSFTLAIRLYLKHIVQKGSLPFELSQVKTRRIKSQEEEQAMTVEEFTKYVENL